MSGPASLSQKGVKRRQWSICVRAKAVGCSMISMGRKMNLLIPHLSRRSRHILACMELIGSIHVTAIGNGDGQGADVIGQHTVGRVDAIVLFADLTSVGAAAANLLDDVKVGLEDVSVVVAALVLIKGRIKVA